MQYVDLFLGYQILGGVTVYLLVNKESMGVMMYFQGCYWMIGVAPPTSSPLMWLSGLLQRYRVLLVF